MELDMKHFNSPLHNPQMDSMTNGLGNGLKYAFTCKVIKRVGET